MSRKLDYIFRFRDNDKFKVFTKIFSYIVLAYVLVCIGFICALQFIEAMDYVAIALILLLSFFRQNDYLFLLAELFTLTADTLMMFHINRPAGFTFFLIVQATYALYFFIRDANKKRQLIITIVRIAIMVLTIVVIAVAFKKKFDYITVVGMLYLFNLLINFACAIIAKDKVLIIFFGLFAFNDLLVGSRQFVPQDSSYFKISHKLNHLPYLISQYGLAFNQYNNVYTRKK